MALLMHQALHADAFGDRWVSAPHGSGRDDPVVRGPRGAPRRPDRPDRRHSVVAAFVVIGGANVDSSNTHARPRAPKARCDTTGGATADRCRSRPPGAGPAATRAAARSGTETTPAPEPHPEGLWLDAAGLVVAFAVGAAGAAVRWRDTRGRGVRREHRARFYRAA